MNYTPTYLEDLARVQKVIPNLAQLKGGRILITGATGLICSSIADFLLNLNDTMNLGLVVYITARNKEKAVDRFGELLDRDDAVFVEYDALSDIDWNYELDYIIHGASPANPALYATKPVETMLANIIGINNILKYAREHNVKRVLFVSSSEVYGKKDSSKPYGEKEYGYVDLLNPRACYPSAKRACETLCASYGAEYDVDSVIVRLGHVYGPTAVRQDTRASSQFFYDVLDGHDIVMKSAGLQMRSYTYVVDCVSAILSVLINGKKGDSYNVSCASSVVSIRDLAETIAKKSGKHVIFEHPSEAELRGYNMMDNSSLTSDKIEGLGWSGCFNLEDGVLHTIKILKGE